MDVESGVLGAVGLLGGLAISVLAILAILIPLSAYSAQKSVYKCFQERKSVNRRLDGLGVSLRYLVDVEANKLTAAQPPKGSKVTAGKVREVGR